MELLTKILIWLAPGIAVAALWTFWGWLVVRICGRPRPEITAMLMFLTIAVSGLVFVVLYNYERATADLRPPPVVGRTASEIRDLCKSFRSDQIDYLTWCKDNGYSN